MTQLLEFLLVSHVITGLLGVIAFYGAWLSLLHVSPDPRFLRRASLGGLVFLLLSWFTGGYYYATYYGQAVRSVIKAGPYPWAHTVFMEAKEHIFLFLPFLAVVVTLLVWQSAPELSTRPDLKRALTWLTGVLTGLGIIITLAGAVVSGAVR